VRDRKAGKAGEVADELHERDGTRSAGAVRNGSDGSNGRPRDRDLAGDRCPTELEFEAFAQVQRLSRWWGPEGFTTTTTRGFEFRAGGVWDFVMHKPDGTDYQEWISWTEMAPRVRSAGGRAVRAGSSAVSPTDALGLVIPHTADALVPAHLPLECGYRSTEEQSVDGLGVGEGAVVGGVAD
jgi:hypothetical protein